MRRVEILSSVPWPSAVLLTSWRLVFLHFFLVGYSKTPFLQQWLISVVLEIVNVCDYLGGLRVTCDVESVRTRRAGRT